MFGLVTFNWDVNLGSILAALAIVIGVWQAHAATRRQSQEMHTENKAQIQGLKDKLDLVIMWMNSQWRGGGN